MRPLLVLGVVTVAIGGFILVRGFSVTQRDRVELGPISATVERQEPVSPWIGGVLVAVGAVLTVASIRRRS